jgi:uncharacterized protein (DUF1501 family)
MKQQDKAKVLPALSRRSVLGASATLAAANLFTGQAKASSRTSLARPVLVQLFLRQGMDGCTMVVPHGDDNYYNLRPDYSIPAPGLANGALDLDGFFGLAPSAAPFLTPYGDGRLLFVHASGSHDPTRSHFEAFARMEVADPSLPLGAVSTGWITRFMHSVTPGTGALRAIGTNPLLPLSLRGAPKTLPIPDFENFAFPGRVITAAERQVAIGTAYSYRPAPLGTAALDSIAAFGLGGVDFAAYVPENGAVYPASNLGRRMKAVAALMKADIGVEAFNVDVDGWDLHANIGVTSGAMARLLADLSKAVEAFYLDMAAYVDEYVMLGITEFGRHMRQNASAGFDHGHGSCLFVMGGHVNGGQVWADWPGTHAGDLDNGDLAITLDYRDVVGEILKKRMGITDLSVILPTHVYVDHGFLT